MQPNLGWEVAAVGAVLGVAAYFVGRWRSGERVRALEVELKGARGELEHTVLEVETLRGKLSSIEEEYDQYRLNVVDHFSGTSDLLRDLTVQYQSVYQHLTKGAATLCPEGFVGLTEGLAKPQLASPPPDLETAENEAVEEPTPSDEYAPCGDAAAPGASV